MVGMSVAVMLGVSAAWGVVAGLVAGLVMGAAVFIACLLAWAIGEFVYFHYLLNPAVILHRVNTGKSGSRKTLALMVPSATGLGALCVFVVARLS